MALTIGAVQSSKGVPKSVAEITNDASDYEFNALIPLKYWVRAADALTKQVRNINLYGIISGKADNSTGTGLHARRR